MKKYEISYHGGRLDILAAESYRALCLYIRIHNAGIVPEGVRIYPYTGKEPATAYINEEGVKICIN